jgi:DNA adenine methylase
VSHFLDDLRDFAPLGLYRARRDEADCWQSVTSAAKNACPEDLPADKSVSVPVPVHRAVPYGSTLVRRRAAGGQRLTSPLRYPGAKRQLIPLFNELLVENPVGTFIEPFAGGASISLHVAVNGLADRVVIGEADPIVYAFWRTACYDTAWLVEQIQTVAVTVENWESFKTTSVRTRRDRALSCLFLNRTSFSGILHNRAGPIGGRRQTSDYPIDCRFPRAELIRRVRVVGQLAAAGRIGAVLYGDYKKTIKDALDRFTTSDALLYLDPPFFAKAQTLYRLSFDSAAHRGLADYLLSCHIPWLLSYDHHPAIQDLYSTPLIRLPGESTDVRQPSHHLSRRTLTYTAHSQRGSGDEYIVTTLPKLPATSRTR